MYHLLIVILSGYTLKKKNKTKTKPAFLSPIL